MRSLMRDRGMAVRKHDNKAVGRWTTDPSLRPFITEASDRAFPTASAQARRGERSKTSDQGRRFLRSGCRRTCIQPGIRI